MVKIIILLILSSNILLHKGAWIFQRCDWEIAEQAVPPIIWHEQTSDGQDQNRLITRFLHNKGGVLLSQTSQCYFQNLDPYQLYKTIGTIGLISFFYLIYRLIDMRKFILLSLFFLIPILPFFKVSTDLQIIFYKLIATSGLALFIKDFKWRKK